MKIDERTYVPVVWIFVALAFALGPTAIGAMWVKGVNDRLAVIESKLGVQASETHSVFIHNAEAKDDGG